MSFLITIFSIIYFSICLDFSHICSRHFGIDFFFFNLYIHIWILDSIIVENLESWKFIVNDTQKNLYEFLH